jgi:hypothetical protein
MRFLGFLGVMLGATLVLLFLFFRFSPDGHNVRVWYDAESRETVFACKNCSMRLSVREVEPYILHWSSESQAPPADQLAMFDRMLDKLPANGQYTKLFIGRLEKAFGQDRTLSNRLKAAAKKRRLAAGKVDFYLKTIANEEMIYPELQELFAKHGYLIKIIYFEKILVDPVDKLPYDGLTWFSLEKK